MPVTWLLTVGQPAVGPVSAVNGQSGIIGNQAEMMELEAAVIDGTRFLCYDDGATGSACPAAGLLTRTRISGVTGPACRVGPVGWHCTKRCENGFCGSQKVFFTTFEQLEANKNTLTKLNIKFSFWHSEQWHATEMLLHNAH